MFAFLGRTFEAGTIIRAAKCLKLWGDGVQTLWGEMPEILGRNGNGAKWM